MQQIGLFNQNPSSALTCITPEAALSCYSLESRGFKLVLNLD